MGAAAMIGDDERAGAGTGGWDETQLTFGTEAGRFHAHSYYDIPVMDAAGARLVGVQTTFVERQPGPDDAVTVGVVATDSPGSWTPLATTTAWSWQQGPMAQWLPDDRVIWNDRAAPDDGAAFVARVADPGGDRPSLTLPRPVYAVMPDGTAGLSIDMARLDRLRPGYGYAAPAAPQAHDLVPAPADDGVWRVPLDGGAPTLILSLAEAVEGLRRRMTLRERIVHRFGRFRYWFNHLKIAPDGARFTAKLRWRRPGGPWSGRMGVSLTCGTAGTGAAGGDLRLLGRATSHVIWLGSDRLYYYDEIARRVVIRADAAPQGHEVGRIAPDRLRTNVHLRHLPPGTGDPDALVYDTPYREDPILWRTGPDGRDPVRIAAYANHVPPRGPFRCDLHPCPDATGRRIAVTSMRDGGRQIYLLTRR